MKLIFVVIYLYTTGLTEPTLTIAILTNAETIYECEQSFLSLIHAEGRERKNIRVVCEERLVEVPS